jgi:hypothetical protein
MNIVVLIKDFWSLIVAILGFFISTILYKTGYIKWETEIAAVIISLCVFAVSEQIRQHIFRDQVLFAFKSLTEAKVLNNTSAFFKELLDAIKSPDTKKVDVCYFTQQPPTDFYNLPHVRDYWTTLPTLLLSGSDKILRRIIMVGNQNMYKWLIEHIEENKEISNYSLAVLVDDENDNAYLNLCLTDDCQCYLFSPHSVCEQPSYVCIKNEGIYKSLLFSYERIWNKAFLVMRGGRIEPSNLKKIEDMLKIKMR